MSHKALRRSIAVALAAPVLGIGAFALVYINLPADRISQATCDRIKEGMTEAEVIAMLGRKWDEHVGGGLWNGRTYLTVYWRGAQGHIRMVLAGPMEEEQRVEEVRFGPSDSTWWERVREHFGM